MGKLYYEELLNDFEDVVELVIDELAILQDKAILRELELILQKIEKIRKRLRTRLRDR